MHILYKITYLPHINTKFPKYYIGSKHNYKKEYYGSVASAQIFDYTNGMKLKDWWKSEVKKNRENFLFEILEVFETITTQELVLREYDLHKKLNVLGDDFFNNGVATRGFVSSLKSYKTREIMSLKTKMFWDSPAGAEKKRKLGSPENREKISRGVRKSWENPTEKMLNKKIPGRTKGSKNKKEVNKPMRKIKYLNEIYENAVVAAKIHKITPHSVRRRCRLSFRNEWSYI